MAFCSPQPKAKKKKKTGYDLETELAQCMEILKKDIQEKRFSDKINYRWVILETVLVVCEKTNILRF